MGNIQSTPPPSTTTSYDVFINLRGEDTRLNFTSHLYEALCKKDIETFIDEALEKGDPTWPNLQKNIRESKISVVVFSKDYASSTWCLRELVEIMECKEKKGQTVIPVFYSIDPSHVRKQIGSFEDSFVKHDKEFQEEAPKWRKALTEASNLTGWDSAVTKSGAVLVKEIVEDILKKLMSKYTESLGDFKGLFGIDEQLKQVMSLLCPHNDTDIRIVGIWGMGGIGKTTIADAIFNSISSQFNGKCFLQNVRERLEMSRGSVSLQEEFLSKVLNDEGNIKLDGLTFSENIKKKLRVKKVFIVLDDVDNFKQLDILARGLDKFGPGSRIMMTSRNKQVLRNCTGNDHNIYEVKALNDPKALELFCNFAFKNDHPTDDLMVLSEKIVNYAKGIPLALKVLGSSLFRKSTKLWESAIANLQTHLDGEIFDVLKISYDGLKEEEKDIFLDIACFFKGVFEKNVAKLHGDRCSYLLSVLEDKSLIAVTEYRTIEMHDLLQEMGRKIVDKESNRPGNRSRLWKQEDVLDTLKNGDGTDAVQGMVLYLDCLVEDINLSPQAFEKMKNLRFIIFVDWWPPKYKMHCPNGDLIYLSNQLRSLHWSHCPLKELPSTFKPQNLIHLDLSCSSLERLWEDTVCVPKLKRLNLSHSRHLTSISKCLDAPLLEEMDLKGCISLVRIEIHCESLRTLDLSKCIKLRWISHLSKASLLEEIILTDCESLPDFPRLAQQLQDLFRLKLDGCKNIKSFPSKIHFGSLRYLDLSGCNNLAKFPQIYGNIRELSLSGTAIDEVPSSIQNLAKLEKLSLSECKSLEVISTCMCELKCLRSLNLENCSKLMRFPEILDTMERMEDLYLSGTAIKELPNSIIHMVELSYLYLRNCKNLEKLPDNICNLKALYVLDFSDCSKLKILPENLENLINLSSLSMDRVAISQLPYGMRHWNQLEVLSCRGCRGLVFTTFLDLPCSLKVLSLSDCNLKEIPEDIGHLSRLKYLDLSGNNFESLPESFRQSNVFCLNFCNCTMLQSLTNLPLNLQSFRSTRINKKSINHLPFFSLGPRESISNLPEFENLKFGHTNFILTNCLNLKETEVSNILERIIKEEIEKHDQEEFGSIAEPSLCCPGSNVPGWFNYQNHDESWIQFQTELHDGDKGQIVGFAVCAVLEFKKYRFNFDREDKRTLVVIFECSLSDEHGNSLDDPFKNYNGFIRVAYRNRALIKSDHVALAISKFSHRRGPESEYTNFTYKFRLSEESCHCRVKSCGVHPIYEKHNIIPPSISNESFGETSVKEHNKIRKFPDEAETSGGSNDDRIEPHPKRTCFLPDLNL